MFYDQIRINVKAGDGGKGAMHMRREKYVPRGGPDGGDGGRGGSVFVEASNSINTLLAFRFKRHFKAPAGGPGGASKRHGAAGNDLTIQVPPGTVVRDAATNETIADVVEHGQRVMVARGGRGGLGNVHFTTSTQRAPDFAQNGEPGEERNLELELRVISDVGLVGYPNAGKSSLLAAISAARPKVAEYPFTTLEPNLGVVGIDDESFVVADIPGLIEGAHEGVGLGLQFLRHVLRTQVLIHVLDAAGTEGRDPLEDFERINRELEEYSADLVERTQVVAANKMDLPAARAQWPRLEAAFQERGIPVFAISAATREGLEPLLRAVAARLAEVRREAAERAQTAEWADGAEGRGETGGQAGEAAAGVPPVPDHQRYTPLQESREFQVHHLGEREFAVTGKAVERVAAMTDFSAEGGRKFFQTRLRQMGVAAALGRAGAQAGDTVHLGEVTLEWLAPITPPPPPRRTARQRKVG